ncbi:MAG: glycosyltransferase family 2 protein [Sphingobium sp.]|nr:glycosyltransferase family 2 protein [Sphingobium sp.]MBP9156516.1 glycosyltransferase family 2 protein [Sphingobium sp.]
MLNIVIPMAGAGSRFAKAGFVDPKPLIRVKGVPMIEVIVNNLRPVSIPHRFIFICQNEHVKKYDLGMRLEEIAPGSQVIGIDGLTEGAACTVLKARSYINNNDPLMIANSDQFVDISIEDYLEDMMHRNLDGLIMTMEASDPKWSFVEMDNELVTRVVEKEVISNEATVGIYNFKSGYRFVEAAEEMIHDNERVNGEFYVAPVYNYLIRGRKRIGIFNIGSEGNGMYGLGIPEDLEKFIHLPVSEQIGAPN